MPMIPLGLKETKDIDFRDPFKVSEPVASETCIESYRSGIHSLFQRGHLRIAPAVVLAHRAFPYPAGGWFASIDDPRKI